MTQEIIIYRNPAEKAMWDAISGGEVFPFMVAGAVFILAFVLTAKTMDKYVPWRLRKAWWTQAVLWGIPAVAAIATVKIMVI